jgi:rubredoxin
MMNPNELQEHAQQRLQQAVQQISPEACPICGSTLFTQAIVLRKMPALLSPTGQPGLAVAQAGYACLYCNWVWNPEGSVPVPEHSEQDTTAH